MTEPFQSDRPHFITLWRCPYGCVVPFAHAEFGEPLPKDWHCHIEPYSRQIDKPEMTVLLTIEVAQ